MPFFTVLALLAVFLTVAALTYLLYRFGHRHNALAYPNERSSHKIPTPHGGGIAFTLMALMLASAFAMFDWVPDWSMFAFVVLGGVMLVLGVWDDFRNVSPVIRLLVHIAVVVAGFWAIPQLPTLYIFGWYVETMQLWWTWPILVFGWVWLINLYNFMDGIDGLAAIQAVLLFAAMTVVFWLFAEPQWALICLFMLASVSGFAVLNWAPAKIFMGDGGSGFLGFIIGFLMLLSASQTQVSMWSWLIMLALFIADATTTLMVRLGTGQAVFQAHRLHAYQKLTDSFEGRHDRVTLLFATVMTVVLFPAALIANYIHHSGFWLFSGLFVLFSAVAFKLGAGRETQTVSQ